MLLIEQKVIDEIPKIYKLINVNDGDSKDNHRQARKLLNKLVATMLDAKEVEVVDIVDKLKEFRMRDNDAEIFELWLIKSGYQLIKIKQ